jgi:quercetin dioxygenase-like cupin family protein
MTTTITEYSDAPLTLKTVVGQWGYVGSRRNETRKRWHLALRLNTSKNTDLSHFSLDPTGGISRHDHGDHHLEILVLKH